MRTRIPVSSYREEPSFRIKVEKAVDAFIRPYLHMHKGDILVREIHGCDVGLVLTGHCAGCPASQLTMEEIVDKQLRRHIGPGLGRVYLINETDAEVLAFAKSLLMHEDKKHDKY